MGKRIDVVLIIGPVIFVLEFKVGESHFTSSALDQVTDYCLDLKNFHETSANYLIAPILIATASRHIKPIICETRGIANRVDTNRGSSPTVREGSISDTGALLNSRTTAPGRRLVNSVANLTATHFRDSMTCAATLRACGSLSSSRRW